MFKNCLFFEFTQLGSWANSKQSQYLNCQNIIPLLRKDILWKDSTQIWFYFFLKDRQPESSEISFSNHFETSTIFLEAEQFKSGLKGGPVEEQFYRKTSQYSKFKFSLPKNWELGFCFGFCKRDN